MKCTEHAISMLHLRGRPASPGVVRGASGGLPASEALPAPAVLVVRTLEAGALPGLHWRGVQAIVLRGGGPLSNLATVARELGLPTVVGVQGATRIPRGATLTVDGTRGTVRVEQPRSAERARALIA